MTNSELESPEGALTDSNLEVVAAMQAAPRATWAVLAETVHSSPATVRRRWESLRNTVWITSYPGFGIANHAIIQADCESGSIDDVAYTLRTQPKIMTVSSSTGGYSLTLTLFFETLVELRALIRIISTVPGVTGVRTSLSTNLYADGSRWRALGAPGSRLMTPGTERGQLDRGRADGQPATREQWRAVLTVLEQDGRAPSSEVARALGVTETHARRVLQRLLQHNWITQRVDVSLSQRIWTHSMTLWISVPAARLDQAATAISSLHMTRVCTALAGGPANLYVMVWLTELAEAAQIEADLVKSLNVRVVDRTIVLHYYKRIGHLFNANWDREGFVSWVGDPPT